METFIVENFEFEKFHGLGNDYILVNALNYNISDGLKPKLAKLLCERHFSIGADGLIFVCPSSKADIRMRIYNKDGSEAEMCGNGIRCFCKYIYEHSIVKKLSIKIETPRGIVVANLFSRKDDNVIDSVQIDMGPPILDCELIPVDLIDDKPECINEELVALNKIFKFTAISTGNPHAVIFSNKIINDDDLKRYGPVIESHDRFPEKTNVEFVKVVSDSEAYMRVFERGVGITNSCGTGTCASVVAGTILGKFKKNAPITVHNDGGDLIITYTGKTVFMEGPAIRVFKGTIEKLSVRL